MSFETAREYDSNGWPEIKGNPISKVGVYPYRGSMIDPSGELGLDPEGIYNVYRSAEELSSPETLESFKLIPWVDEHLMLGEGFEPAESKGIEGVIGEDVYFEDGYLRGNLKLFTDEHAQRVADGKIELSCGYRCEYALEDGVFGDQNYTVVQTKIRGNHLASIDEGRMGPEVSVLDQKLTFAIDAKDFNIMPKPEKTLENFATDGVEPEEFGTALKLIAGKLCAMDADDDDKAEDEDEDKAEDMDNPDLGQDEDKDDKAEDEDKDDKAEDGDDDDDDDDDKAEDRYDDDEKSGAMDALDTKVRKLEKVVRRVGRMGMKSVLREIRKRDALYAQVSPVIGTFDHADMTADEMAKYACKKLSLWAPAGHEGTAINAYFVNRSTPQLFATDSAVRVVTPKAGGVMADFFAR